MNCHLCQKENLTEIIDLKNQPLANKYPFEKDFESEDFFPLTVLFCQNCKNLQLGSKVSRERMFLDYYYLSSVNQGLVRHFENFARELQGSDFVVDIGSNDGILLKPLKELGIRCLGVDPSINVGKIANDAGLETLISFFDLETAEKIKTGYGKPSVIVASSIFTHLDDPHKFIDAVKVLLADNGRFIVEVEYSLDIIKKIQFERFYLDRIFYYSLTSLDLLFKKHGLLVVDAEKIEPHGGSIRVTAKIDDGNLSQSAKVKELLEEERQDLSLEALQKFKQAVDTSLSDFKEKLLSYKKEGLLVAGYSAPARVSTICNYGQIDSSLIRFIVDDSPLKQNRFSPGTHIPIVPKEFLENHKPKPDILVVFAYEYLDDIKKKTDYNFRYLIPIPPREA